MTLPLTYKGIPAYAGMVRKQHALADQGSYFIVNNAQTGVVEGVIKTYTATAPTLVIVNTDNAQNPQAKSLYIDYIDLAVSVVGLTATAVTALWYAIYVDNINRYASGGTNLTANIARPNSNLPLGGSVAAAYFGAVTATAASLGNNRAIVGQRLRRMPVTATTAPEAVGDRFRLEFGGVEEENTGPLGTTGALMANVFQQVQKVPPVVIGPGGSLLLFTYTACTTYTTGTTWLPEAAWWEF